jgi:hypothetical protein
MRARLRGNSGTQRKNLTRRNTNRRPRQTTPISSRPRSLPHSGPSGGRGAGCTRAKWKRGLAAAAGQEQRTWRWPQRDRKASPVKAGSGVKTVFPNGGDEGPVGGDKGGVFGHELPDTRDQARKHSDKGRVVAVVAAAMRLPKRRQAEEAEPNPEGLSSRRRARGPAVIG